MEKKDSEFPTMEERLERLKNSRAVSPANAAAKVITIGGMEPEEIFKKNGEKELFADMLSEQEEGSDRQHDRFRRADGKPIRRYQELMPVLEKLLPGDTGSHAGVLKPEPDYDLTYGRRFTNAMLLLALVFYYSDRDEKRQSRLGACMRMTVGDYTDAVVDLSFTDDGKSDEKHLKWARAWKKKLVAEYGETTPLALAIEKILDQYLEGWQMIGYAEHVAWCGKQLMEELAYQDYMAYLNDPSYSDEYEEAHDDGDENEEPGDIGDVDIFEMPVDEEPENDEWQDYYVDEYGWEEEDWIASDPLGFYLGKAREYHEKLPILADCELSVTGLAEKFFLKRDIYRMDVYREEFPRSGNADFRKILEKHVSDANFLKSLDKINSAVGALKMFLYDPYHGSGADDGIEKYHYERHLGLYDNRATRGGMWNE